MPGEPLIAVFVDFENLAIGAQVTESGRFQIELVLKRLLEKGRIVYKRAYCDWSRYRQRGTGVPRSRDWSGRHSPDPHEWQEQCGHPHGGRCAGPLLLEGPHRHVRPALGRQRLLATRVQAQGERQARHRSRRQEVHVRPSDRGLRRVHLLRRFDSRGQAETSRAVAVQRKPRARKTRRSTSSWKPSSRWTRTTTRSGAR